MRILLVAATQQEIEPYCRDNKHVDILITGVGVPPALYHIQKKILQQPYDLVIQAGIAGSFTEDLEPGKVVVIKQDTFGDIGMEEGGNFTSIYKTGFYAKDEFPFVDGWLVNPNDLLNSFSLPVVKAITVSKVSDSKVQLHQFINSFSPQVESMEGAALHYICLQENRSFLQLRGISNFVGERNKTAWRMKEAIENLNFNLAQIINGLTNNK